MKVYMSGFSKFGRARINFTYYVMPIDAFDTLLRRVVWILFFVELQLHILIINF